MIDIKDSITLSDNNEYLVCGKVNKDNKICYCLIDIHNKSNIKFCYEKKTENDIELIEINANDVTADLLSLFADSLKDEI